MDRYCIVPDCLALAERNGLCATHRKRQQRGQPLATPIPTPFQSTWDRIHAAALELADAPADDDSAYRRAEDRLRKAIQARVDEVLRNMSPARRRM